MKKILWFYFRNTIFDTLWFSVPLIIGEILILVYEKLSIYNFLLLLCLLIILLLNTKHYILPIKARKDLKNNQIYEKNILIHSITIDPWNNYFSKGGIMQADPHLIIEDHDHQIFRVVRKRIKGDYDPQHYSGLAIKVKYLENSRIVVGIETKNQSELFQEFYQDYKVYFIEENNPDS